MNLDRCLLLSWIEEDNIQKAYFRVRPLLTAEGDARAEAEALWPTEGCLRIVPDRNELHTFKSRMRALGNYCVVDLRGLPADAGKIRTNKNFSLARGEANQYILYSDTVKALPAHSFYEIIEGKAQDFAAACEKAITPRFFIREGDTLYGPVDREKPAQPETAREAAGTLFEMPCPDGVQRMILCMDDAPAPALRAPVMRSNAAAAKPLASPAAKDSAPMASADKDAAPADESAKTPAEAPAAPAAEEAPTEAPAAPASEEEPVSTEAPAGTEAPAAESAAAADAAPETPADEPAAPEVAAESVPQEQTPSADEKPLEPSPVPEKQSQKHQDPEPEAAEETSLPIGQRLNILDQSKDFKETLQSLDKPVSRSANLLNQRESRPLRPQPVPAARPGQLGGTHLVQTPLRTSTPQPKNRLQELATSQYSLPYEPPTDNLPKGIRMHDVHNPVEAACASLRQAWHHTDSHPQLLDCILSLDGFRSKLESRLCRSSGSTLMQKLLRDRLQDLEAERLTALCELDRARRDADAYRDELLGGMKNRIAQETSALEKTRDEAQERVDALKAELNGLQAQRDALVSRVEQLQQDALPAETARLLADAQMLSPTLGSPLRMAPVSGGHVPVEELIARLTAVCEASGIKLSRNHAIAVLTLLALAPRFGVVCPTVAPYATLVRNIVAAFGWKSGFAHQVSQEQRPMVAARPVDSTPAILMTSMPSYAPLSGVSKVLLSRNVPGMIRNAAYDADPWPVLTLPALPYVEELEGQDAAPVSAASLAALLDAPAIDPQTLRTTLDPVLRAATPLSGAARRNMFRFISVCAPLMEGGLAAAADWAILLWIVPGVDRQGRHYGAVKAALDEYPLSQAAL